MEDQINQCSQYKESVRGPTLKQNLLVGPQGKINDGARQVVQEASNNWAKITHATSMKEPLMANSNPQ